MVGEQKEQSCFLILLLIMECSTVEAAVMTDWLRRAQSRTLSILQGCSRHNPKTPPGVSHGSESHQDKSCKDAP